jgi:hypothetical protein
MVLTSFMTRVHFTVPAQIRTIKEANKISLYVAPTQYIRRLYVDIILILLEKDLVCHSVHSFRIERGVLSRVDALTFFKVAGQLPHMKNQVPDGPSWLNVSVVKMLYKKFLN